MKTYLDLLRKILTTGELREDRTGTGTLGLFGEQLKIDLQDGFPLLTTKRVPFKSVVAELLWFLRGDTSAASLRADGCTIWDEWATREQCAKFGRKEDDLGPIYGFAWRHFGGHYPFVSGNRSRTSTEAVMAYQEGGFDQIRWLVDEIKKNPFSRRLVVSAWNPPDAAVVALPPCHTLFQCCVQTRGETNPMGTRSAPLTKSMYLSLHLYMRSADYFLGVPFNIASYALLTHLLSREVDMKPGTLTISFGDVHLYRNHFAQAKEQLAREPRQLPRLALASEAPKLLDTGWSKDQISVVDYDPYPAIKAEVSV